MKAFNKRKRTKNSFKGRYRFVGYGYRFCQAGDMWKWKVLHDFRIRDEHMRLLQNDTQFRIEILGETPIPDWMLFDFSRCMPKSKKEEVWE